MYKLIKDLPKIVNRTSDNAFIPFDPANTDYQTFKAAVLAGAELQDADGVAMTHDAAVAYVKTLP